MTATLQGKIEIPYGTGDEVLELEVANLPDPNETAGILSEQDCKINLWIQIAIEYYRQGNFDAFELLLNTCLGRWTLSRVKNSASTYPDGYKDMARALDLLAIYYVRKGSASTNKEKVKNPTYIHEATKKISDVDKSELLNLTTTDSILHILARAYYLFLDNKSENSYNQFKFVSKLLYDSNLPENIPALLGEACLTFYKKEPNAKTKALALYKKCIQLCPNCPADVRLALGNCFYKLNMFGKAEEAFSRTLALDPKCVGALVGTAIIELNKRTAESVKRGIECVSRAYRLEPTNPMVLTLLADHFFYANDQEKVIKLATKALNSENTDNEAMKAQACYQLGRAFHKKKEYDNAFEYYYKATQFGGSRSYLAFYGLGQIYIHKKELDSATQAFETVLKSCPDNIETLKVLASLYARLNDPSKKELAQQYLKKVTEKRPNDCDAWVELASLTEQNDTQTALSAYKTSLRIYEERSIPIPPELYNNYAALLFSIQSLDESEKYYNLALTRCNEEMPNNELHYGSIIYTIKYNLGRLYEAKHQLVEAEKTYKNILIQHPMYLDCYLRLGCMERDKGLLFDASDKFKETFTIDPDNFEAWTLIGNLHLSKLELTPCQKKFERILERTKSNPDCYSLVSVGNVWLQSQYQQFKDHDKLNQQRNRALSFYKYALKYDKRNIYAASGIGCILAVKGMFNEARDVFSQVREATADFPDVWINLAHIYVEQKQYAAAVQMYENCLRRFYNNSSTEILSYMARALYKANKLSECKRILLKARQISPHDLVILFNLAKVLKTLARQIFEDRKSTYQAVVDAEYELKLAQSYFKFYAELKGKTKSEHERGSIDLELINLEERDCNDLLLQVEKSIKQDAEQRDRDENIRRQEHEEQLAKEIARKTEEEEKRMIEERRKKEEMENKRKELLKKQEEAKKKMLQESSGAIVIDDGSDEGENRGKKRKKSSKESRRRRDDEKRARKEQNLERENKKYKSRAILSSDSSESSGEEESEPVRKSMVQETDSESELERDNRAVPEIDDESPSEKEVGNPSEKGSESPSDKESEGSSEKGNGSPSEKETESSSDRDSGGAAGKGSVSESESESETL